MTFPDTSRAASRVTAWSTFNIPLTVVTCPGEAILTAPPPVASEVTPVESKVSTDVSPVTSRAASRVTDWSTFNIPLTVVTCPGEAILTAPPPVASEVTPVESKVSTDVSPVTSRAASRVTAWSTFNVPLTVVTCPGEAILTAPPLVAIFITPDPLGLISISILLSSPIAPIIILPPEAEFIIFKEFTALVVV